MDVNMQQNIEIRKGFTQFQLKTIALVLMVFDHIHYFFSFTDMIPEWFSMIGRLSAPLFLFCVVEGFIHTHNRKKYFLRMYGMTVAMGIIQYIMIIGIFARGDGFYPQNQILANFIILIVILQGIVWLDEKHFIKGILAVILPLVWPIIMVLIISEFPVFNPWVGLIHYTILPIHTAIMDGGTFYILTGILLYLSRNHRKWQAIGYFITNISLNGILVYFLVPGLTLVDFFTTNYEWMGAFAAILMLLYNKEKGKGNKHLFYWFYPIHIYVLFGLSCLLYSYLH